MKTASAYKSLRQDEKQFLSDIAKQVAMLVAEPQKMDYFQKQLSEFADKWAAYETAKEAERKGKWQPLMGRPSNPLWAIWPRNAGPSCFPDFGDIPSVLGAYVILAVIHDNVLPHCPLIAKGIMPKELFNKIWQDLVTGANEECRALPIITPDKIMVIPISKVKNFLQNVTDDIKSHFSSKKGATQKLVAITDLANTKQQNEQTISQLIAQGEGDTTEFKETLEYDIKTNINSKDVLLSSLKTIAGFLNSNGGTLLIGVTDSREIKGIERDLSTMKHGNNDRFELKIRNCLKDRFSPQLIGKVKISFEKFTEGTICRVDVPTNKDIIHLDGDIYVRDGNTTQKPEGRDRTDWIQKREN